MVVPPLKVTGLQLGEMAFVTVTPDEMDVSFLRSTLRFPISLTNRHGIEPASLIGMPINEGTRLLYRQRCRALHPGRSALIG